MTIRSEQTPIATDDVPQLAIWREKVCRFILKAREFDVKDANSDPDSGSNPTDDTMIDVLEDHPDDPVEQELRSAVADLAEDEKIDLVALAWLGRGDGTLADWASLRTEAARTHADHAARTVDYLLGEPLISDQLEEALAMFGLTCKDVASEQL